ncbi:MAG: bifunctional lysylphosphatidylglycerol flippase/synthetase MprF [Actinomycetota bacterium]
MTVRSRTSRATDRATDWIRFSFGWLVAMAGILDIISVLNRPVSARIRFLNSVFPFAVSGVAHVIEVQSGLMLLLFARMLARGKRVAWAATVLLLLTSSMLHVLKGLDIDQAVISGLLAIALLVSGNRFRAASDAPSLKRAIRLTPFLIVAPFAYGLGAMYLRPRAIVGGWPGVSSALSEVGHRLVWIDGPVHFIGRRPAAFGVWFPRSITGMGLISALYLLFLFFRPVVRPIPHRTPEQEQALRSLVASDKDTLSYFLLRDDKLVFLDSSSRSAIGYTVRGSIALISGDPVGPRELWPQLLNEFVEFAHERGWRVGALGVGSDALPVWESTGFQTMYLGDEALIDPKAFSLEGRPIRKVRQSVANAERAGFRAEWYRVSEIGPDLRRALRHISEGWKGEDVERGFSMTLGRLLDPRDRDCVVALARDREGYPKGFIHFVPAGKHGYSLDIMRRDRDTPSSLNDMLIVRTIEHFREEGVDVIGLNFSFWRTALDKSTPAAPGKRIQRWIAQRLGPWFQIESLHKFNKKFFPQWEPRYLAYEAKLSVPAVFIAALRAERLLDLQVLRRGQGGKRLKKPATA